MHARISYIQHFILLVTFGLLAACSDSNTTEPSQIPITEKVLFPFIQDHTLYNFNPDTGTNKKLAESNKFLMIGLDIDQSEASTNDEDSSDTFLNHTDLPEYVVYVEDQTLRLYDLFTRRDHLLTSFAATNEQTDDEFICDLKPSITVDKAHFDAKEILFKHEESVYIKTSTFETCEGTPSSFKYFEIKIEDSFTETFEIRRTTLLKHEHFHTHQHEHDYDHENDHEGNHNHVQDEIGVTLEEGHKHDIDGHEFDENYPDEAPHDHSHSDNNPDTLHTHKHGFNVKDRKNHEHKHEHIHDFKYIIMDEHKFNDDPDTSPEKIHNKSSNQLTETETLPVLVGKRHVIDSALMYAGSPIVDINNKRLGYLGFNNSDPAPAKASYKFFETIDDGTEKIESWKISSSEFLIQPEDYSGFIDRNFSNAVMIEFNRKMVKWNLEDLFDDDKNIERQANIDSPMFTRPLTSQDTYNGARYSINKTNDSIVIYEAVEEIIVDQITLEKSIKTNRMLYTVIGDQAQTLLRTIVDETMELSTFALFPKHIVTLKKFADDTGNAGSSVTRTQYTTELGTLEETVNPISDLTRIYLYPNDIMTISTQDDSNPVFHANYYDSNLTKKDFSPDLENTIFGSISDQRPKAVTAEPSPILLHSETTVTPNSNSPLTALSEPGVYLLDRVPTPFEWQDNFLGTVPTTVTIAYGATIHNELFAQITIQESLTLPETHKTFYFNPNDPTTEMVLMYEEVFNE
jgi:hypothetical protein